MKQDEVYIIGGGASLKGFDFSILKDKDTIVINKAIFYVNNPTYFITMDYIFLKNFKEKIKKKQVVKFFVGAMNNTYLKYKNGKLTDTLHKIPYDLDMIDVLIYSKFDKGIGFDFSTFRHGCNSGFCALQLAIILGYKKINLLGIDLDFKDDTHFHGGYGDSGKCFKKKLAFYILYFKYAFYILQNNPEILIYNCSKISLLKKYLPYKQIGDNNEI